MPSFNPDLFKLAREEKGLSQKALAEQLGVAQSEISKVESGKKVPGEELVDKAASFFGYTPEFFEQVDVVLPEEGIRHRKRSALSATDRARIEAEARAKSGRFRPDRSTISSIFWNGTRSSSSRSTSERIFWTRSRFHSRSRRRRRVSR